MADATRCTRLLKRITYLLLVTSPALAQNLALGKKATPSAHAYQYFDAAPLRTTGHYRLKQLATDGTFAYSPVAVVQAVAPATPSPLSIYPNPTADRTTVTWETPLASVGRWYPTNSLGQVVHAETLSDETTTTLSINL